VDGLKIVFGLDGLQAMLDVLAERGAEVIGPRTRDGAIAARPLTSVQQLPVGCRDEQAPGHYRLVPRDDEARFGWAVGPQTWKPLVHPAQVNTVTMTQHRERDATHVEVHRQHPTPRAFVGVRPCELAAIARLDGVLLGDERPEPVYAANRSALFVVVVNCTAPAATCFCSSMGTGPSLPAGDQVGTEAADIELTELLDSDGRPRYLARPRSDDGREVLAAVAERVDAGPAGDDELRHEDEALDDATASMERHLDTDGLHEAMVSSLDHPHWQDIADRCLACGNCTAVCPTCFCTAVADIGDLSGEVVERSRHWDTCYSLEFSRVGPSVVRESIAARYRQWLVHKLGTWHDQFGESGCVGCGRCITWCPVGIDLTAEVPILRDRPTRSAPAGEGGLG
jgi:sulfhydrogenase subunit beta (sulfur reductase)